MYLRDEDFTSSQDNLAKNSNVYKQKSRTDIYLEAYIGNRN